MKTQRKSDKSLGKEGTVTRKYQPGTGKMKFFISFLAIFLHFSWILGIFADDAAKNEETILIPKLGLGTAALGGNTFSVITQALDLGVELIDTAQAQEWYDEAGVGRAVNQYLGTHPEKSVFIVTKIHPRSFAKEKMRAKLQESLNNFSKHGKLDVVLLHNHHCWEGHCTPEEQAVSWTEGWKNLEELKDEFSIDLIGVSNFDIHLLQDLVLHRANRKVGVIQNWMDPFHQDQEVRSFCRSHNIQYMAYSSFGTQWSQRRPRNPVLTDTTTLHALAETHNTTISAIVLSWLLHEEIIAIPRCASPSHIQENFAVCSSTSSNNICKANVEFNENDIPIQLTDDEIESVRALDGVIGDLWLD
jgi:diketogulonate reductase-like aldo/keto reductase